MSSEFQHTLGDRGMEDTYAATDHPISSPGYYNNDWRIDNATHIDPPVICGSPNGLRYITPGMRIKLSHISTEKMLHSHDIRPPVSEVDFQNEVSAYGAPGFQDDANDDWILEIDEAASREAAKTLRTKFRLRHALLGAICFPTRSSYQNGDSSSRR
ncbi:MIR motif-containing protein [Lentinula boryana]|uniref:MIR motif-containing protein n=1 Tax=Lentinula boryana TaxID=40481 RepID=A0ABQ8PWY5_9AGAR|nr:MIR motif-containing protein [Lentinula boryana]